MLKMLNINNYALIDKLELEFSSGLNILTGETGAGKSIIVGAISLLMGGRSQAEYIRDKEMKTWVEGCFDFEPDESLLAMAEEEGIPMDADYLVIRREINPNGKSIARINGVLVQIGFLKHFASKFLNIYGQHDFQMLSDSVNHLGILDNIGKKELSLLKKEVSHAFTDLEKSKKKLAELRKKMNTNQEKNDFLSFQLEELSKAHFTNPEEDKEIDQELMILENQEKISQLVLGASEELYGNGAAYEKVGKGLSDVSELGRYIENIKKTEERLQNIYYEIEDIVLELKQYIKETEFDSSRLDFLNERKFFLQRIKKKYNLSLPELMEKKSQIEEELNVLGNMEFFLEEAEKELEKALASYHKISSELSEKRKEIGLQLEEKISQELQYLGMNNVIFKTLLIPDSPSSNGSDKAEFLISANLGEEPKPISKIASGGEMSRIMLSLKVIMTDDGVSTMIFDEIDSGIGGETIVKVANKLSQVAQEKQVLCVTHSPQVAAVANEHFLIKKVDVENRTQTQVFPLDNEKRIEELSRMLGDKSDAGKEFANNLLKNFGYYGIM